MYNLGNSIQPSDCTLLVLPELMSVIYSEGWTIYILIPDTWVKEITTTSITPAIHSDHRIVKLAFCKGKSIVGPHPDVH